MQDFVIRQLDSAKELQRLRAYLLSNPRGYPQFDKWVEEVCLPEIDRGWKTAILAFYDGYLVGDAIYQKHKELPRTREFKNMIIHPDLRRRDLGHFLLRQLEVEDRHLFDRMILDAHVEDEGTIMFLKFCGFKEIEGRVDLYGRKGFEVVMVKEYTEHAKLPEALRSDLLIS